MLRRIALLIVLALVAVTAVNLWPLYENDRQSGEPQGRSPNIVQIKLSLSNVFLIKGAKPILIDAGSPDDIPAIKAALARENVRLEDLALIVLTHGHADHAGAAAALRKLSQAKIVMGRADAALAAAGRNDELKPTGLSAHMLRAILESTYPPFTPDLVVDGELDLAPYGIAGRAVLMPGHTAGSLVVELTTGEVFVGDMLLGGTMGGNLFPHAAGEHYFQADLEQDHRNIRTLIDAGFKVFYLGHGGPVSDTSIKRGFASLFAG